LTRRISGSTKIPLTTSAMHPVQFCQIIETPSLYAVPPIPTKWNIDRLVAVIVAARMNGVSSRPATKKSSESLIRRETQSPPSAIAVKKPITSA
jgi:hypothetical protein